jgi:phosphate transport system substrate-binding protein
MKRILAALAALALTASVSMAQSEIAVNGSTTVLPIMQKMVEAFMAKNPQVKITVSGGGSGNGIKALIDGTTPLAMSSREMKSSEVDQAKAKGVTPNSMAIAIDALVPIVHPDNKVDNLTKAQLQGIFAGAVSNWKDVGGEDKPIVVISRDTSSGTYEAWQEMIMEKEKVTPKALLQASSGAVLQTVSKNKYAIGYDSYGYLNKTVKGLSVEGVPGNPETAAAGKFPVSRKLWIITNGKPAGDLGRFVDFMLDPKAGQKIVAESGAVPVAK